MIAIHWTEVGMRLKTTRERRALTQEELAQKALISSRSIVRYENGGSIRSVATSTALAEVLGVRLEWLMRGEAPTDVEAGSPVGAVAEPPSEYDASGNELKPDAPRNPGIIITHADTREVWFTIDFPPYFRVETPLEIRTRAKRPDIHDLELKSRQKLAK